MIESVQDQLKDFLNSNQILEIRAHLTMLISDAIVKVREAMVNKLAELTGIRPEQIVSLRPILRSELEKRSSLLMRFISSPDISFKDFISDFQALQMETRRNLKVVLNADQMISLIDYQEAMNKKIRNIFG